MSLNIYQRLNAVKAKAAYVQKDEKKIDGQYRAVTHDAVTALTRQHFMDAGVIIVPHEVSSEVKDTGTTTGKGTPFIRFEAKYRVDFVNVDEPTQIASVELTSHALDHGDKAPGKAHSYAVKYAILKVLQLETGEDDEGREEQKPKKDTKVTPNAGAGEDMTNAQKQKVMDVAVVVKDCLAEGKEWDAYSNVELAEFDNDEKLFLWAQLNSGERTALKRMAKAERSKQPGVQQ